MWQPDEEAVCCSFPSCPVQFSLFQRKHHCRMCGFVFCSVHSDFKVPMKFNSKRRYFEHDPLHGSLEKVCFSCFSSRIGYAQELGCLRSLTIRFHNSRASFSHVVEKDTAKLLSSYEKLTKTNRMPTQQEMQAAVSWVPDASSGLCLLCHRVFGLFVRRHHCRLCGTLGCGGCIQIHDVTHLMSLILSSALDAPLITYTCTKCLRLIHIKTSIITMISAIKKSVPFAAYERLLMVRRQIECKTKELQALIFAKHSALIEIHTSEHRLSSTLNEIVQHEDKARQQAPTFKYLATSKDGHDEDDDEDWDCQGLDGPLKITLSPRSSSSTSPSNERKFPTEPLVAVKPVPPLALPPSPIMATSLPAPPLATTDPPAKRRNPFLDIAPKIKSGSPPESLTSANKPSVLKHPPSPPSTPPSNPLPALPVLPMGVNPRHSMMVLPPSVSADHGDALARRVTLQENIEKSKNVAASSAERILALKKEVFSLFHAYEDQGKLFLSFKAESKTEAKVNKEIHRAVCLYLTQNKFGFLKTFVDEASST